MKACSGQPGAKSSRLGSLLLKMAVLPLFLPFAAHAASPMATPTAQQTITFCEKGVQCPINSQAFLDGTVRGKFRDAEIMDIVATLAETANTPLVPMWVCRQAAEGLLILSDGLTEVELQDQVVNIAGAMCIDTATASTSKPGDDDGGDDDGGGDGDGDGGGDGGGTDGGGNGVGGTGKNRSGGADGSNPGGGGNGSGFGNPGKGKND